MAVTRKSTNSSKPRIFDSISTSPTFTRKKNTSSTTKKSTTGVTKKRAPATHHKRKAGLGDKIEGAVEKVVGKIEGKPGKEGAGTKKMRGTDGKGSRTAKTTTKTKTKPRVMKN